MMAPLLSGSETTSAMKMISELRKQRMAGFLSRGPIGQEVSFYSLHVCLFNGIHESLR
jgi:hypothetical protein